MILGVFTSIKAFDLKVVLILSSTADLSKKIEEVLGFLKSSALESNRLSIADSTLPVGSMGRGWMASVTIFTFSAFISRGKSFDLLRCTTPDTITALCRGLSLATLRVFADRTT